VQFAASENVLCQRSPVAIATTAAVVRLGAVGPLLRPPRGAFVAELLDQDFIDDVVGMRARFVFAAIG
jgi:hypothetical protein